MRRIIAALLALLLGLALASAPSERAEAHASCLSGWACMHFGPTYTQAETQTDARVQTRVCVSFNGTVANNTIESIYGNYVGTGRYISYWNSHNCTGTVVFWSSGGAYPTLPVSARNVISSFMKCAGPC